MYVLVRTSEFERSLRRFLRKHPNLAERVAHVLRDLESDPFQPHLRLHSLSGGLQGRRAVSVSRAHRIVLIVRGPEREIILIEIGSHDDVYR